MILKKFQGTLRASSVYMHNTQYVLTSMSIPHVFSFRNSNQIAEVARYTPCAVYEAQGFLASSAEVLQGPCR